MSFSEAISSCMRQFADFSGRARRSEYWYFSLFIWLVEAGVAAVFGESGSLYSIATLVLFVPQLAVSWRRLHDIGKSGALWFLNFIPLVGQIILLVFFCREGEHGSNAYGEDPKGYFEGHYREAGFSGAQRSAPAYCRECGAKLEGAPKFCPNCGRRIE